MEKSMNELLDKMISMQKKKPEEYSPLLLAYIGDAVYEVYVRTALIKRGNLPVNELHRLSKRYVSAGAQSEIISKLEESLSDEELRIYKRGRNAKPGTLPKHADVGDYHRATGFEALVGYLYLKGDFERLYSLLSGIAEVYDGEKDC